MVDCEKIINEGWMLGYDNGVLGIFVFVVKFFDGGQILVIFGYKFVKEVGMLMGIFIKDNLIGVFFILQ